MLGLFFKEKIMKMKVRTGYIPLLRKSHAHKDKKVSNKDIVKAELKEVKWI
jgi:hypothetical protein